MDNSGPRGPVNPQAQSASAPLWNPPAPPERLIPSYQAGHPALADDPRRPPVYNGQPQNRPQGQPVPRPEPVFSPASPRRTVEERHEAYLKAQAALHDRHYEDNNLRTAAEIALAKFFLE